MIKEQAATIKETDAGIKEGGTWMKVNGTDIKESGATTKQDPGSLEGPTTPKLAQGIYKNLKIFCPRVCHIAGAFATPNNKHLYFTHKRISTDF